MGRLFEQFRQAATRRSDPPPRAAIEATPYLDADGTEPDSGPSVADFIAQGLDPESAWLARYGGKS